MERESNRSRRTARRASGAVTGRLLGALMVVCGAAAIMVSYKDIRRYFKLRSM